MEYNSTITLREIRETEKNGHPDMYDPTNTLCQDLRDLLVKLDYWPNAMVSKPIPLWVILDILGFDSAMTCLKVPSLDRLYRHFTAHCADQHLHFFEKENPKDDRIRKQIATLRNDDADHSERYRSRERAIEVAIMTEWDVFIAPGCVEVLDSCRAAALATDYKRKVWEKWEDTQPAWQSARKDREAHLRAMIAEE